MLVGYFVVPDRVFCHGNFTLYAGNSRLSILTNTTKTKMFYREAGDLYTNHQSGQQVFRRALPGAGAQCNPLTWVGIIPARRLAHRHSQETKNNVEFGI